MLGQLARAATGGRTRKAALKAAQAAMETDPEEDETEEEDANAAAETEIAAEEDEAEEEDAEATTDAEDDSEEDEDNEDTAQASADAETARCQAIVTSKAGLANPKLAHELAFNTSDGRMSADQAISILEKSVAAADAANPKGALAGRMEHYRHGAGAEGGEGEGSNPLKSVGAKLFGKGKSRA